jgi:hypothetical protein
MSLINQALKKEQQRRSLNLREATSDTPVYDSNAMGNGLSPARQKKNASLSILLGLTGAGVVLLGLGGAFVYFSKAYLSGLAANSHSEEASEQTSLASSPLTSNPVTEIIAQVDSHNAKKPDSGSDLQSKSVQASMESALLDQESNPNAELGLADSGSVENPNADSEVAQNPQSQEEPGEIVESAPGKPQFDFKIQDFVDELQVSGFRSAGANSRLLLGGRVFKLYDIVDNERGLVFRGAYGQNLVFEAPSGYLYRKPL